LVTAGCREEIVPPDNPATNINEPVQMRYRNSYTFLINAEKISFDLVDYPDLRTSTTSLYFTLSDYKSGTVSISILNKDDGLIFSEQYADNLPGFYYEIKGNLPAKIKIRCSDFSGKLKVQLTGI